MLTDCLRFLFVPQIWLFTLWETLWMWVFWEDGAPQRPLVLLPSTEAHLEVSGGMLGLEFLREAETLENREPNQRIRHSHPQLLVFVTEPRNHQVAGKYLFLCQRCVISLREIVPSKLSEPLSYRWGVNHHWSKGRINCKAIVNPQFTTESPIHNSQLRNSVFTDARTITAKSYWTCIPCMAIKITVVTVFRLEKGLILSSKCL